MTKSTVNQIEKRIDWLRRIIEGTISDTNLRPHLENMRSFCRYSLDGEFPSISLNTLKANAHLINKLDNGRDGWEELKQMTRSALERLTASDTSVKGSINFSRAQLEDKLKCYSLQANACYLAFSDLVREVTKFSKTASIINPKDRVMLDRMIAAAHNQLADLRSQTPPKKAHLKLVL